MMNKFLQEIYQQPEALKNTLNYYVNGEGKKRLDEVKSFIENTRFDQIIFTGMGSSYFTSYASSVFLNQFRIHSFAMNASELLHYNLSLLEKKTLLICTSQSGESFEIKELKKVLPSTVYCIGITNEQESSLAKNADFTLLTKSGKEEMTSTKTYVSTLLVSYILGMHLSGNFGDKQVNAIHDLIDNTEAMLSAYDEYVNEMLDFFGETTTLQVIARGANFSTASQSALMFKEAVKVAAAGILGGEFRHGPMEMVQPGFKAILFASKGKTFTQSINMAREIARFGGKVLLLTNDETPLEDENILKVYIKEQDQFLFTILSIIPVQLFIDSYAKARGFEAGSFSRGAKVTVIE
jgi:glucosamine--fructose-6-phosphate aminotransferase (isomerizing)